MINHSDNKQIIPWESIIMNLMYKGFCKLKSVLKKLPIVDILCICIKANKRANTVLKIRTKSYSDYSHQIGSQINKVEPDQYRKVYEPTYYPKCKVVVHDFASPSIYIVELENVIVHGGTGLVISGDLALTDICANDTDNRIYYTCGAIRRGNRKRFYVETSEEIDKIDVAVNLCGLAAGNYYHLTFEILSRYGYLKDIPGISKIPVLLNEETAKYPQFRDLIKTVLGDVETIFVPEYRRVLCKKLIYPSMNTWMPMNVKKQSLFRISDNMIAESAVNNIRNAAKHLMLKKTDRKIYISRKNTDFSRISNEDEVEALFRDNGYEIVCTEDLSYKEQVELFSSASCVVGASGAAMTNLVYCNQGAVFGCIIPKDYKFCIYSTIAGYVGCKMLFYDAKVSVKHKYISREKCVVDLDECKGYISRLETMINE